MWDRRRERRQKLEKNQLWVKWKGWCEQSQKISPEHEWDSATNGLYVQGMFSKGGGKMIHWNAGPAIQILSCCCCCFSFFFNFYARTCSIWMFLGRGPKSELFCQPTPQPWQQGIQAASATYATAWGNARSLTHWARSGIEPACSRSLCRVLNTFNHNGNSLKLLF